MNVENVGIQTYTGADAGRFVEAIGPERRASPTLSHQPKSPPRRGGLPAGGVACPPEARLARRRRGRRPGLPAGGVGGSAGGAACPRFRIHACPYIADLRPQRPLRFNFNCIPVCPHPLLPAAGWLMVDARACSGVGFRVSGKKTHHAPRQPKSPPRRGGRRPGWVRRGWLRGGFAYVGALLLPDT